MPRSMAKSRFDDFARFTRQQRDQRRSALLTAFELLPDIDELGELPGA
jgi:hypothetical protein